MTADREKLREDVARAICYERPNPACNCHKTPEYGCCGDWQYFNKTWIAFADAAIALIWPAAMREAVEAIKASGRVGYVCPYGRDKPGDPTWNHTDNDVCPICRVNGHQSIDKCHDNAFARAEAAILSLLSPDAKKEEGR